MIKAYSEYKNSGIEWTREIPSHWDIKRFKNLFKIKKDIAGALGFNVLSITQRGIKIKDIESGEGQVASDYTKYQKVNAGDFAMNHMDLLTGFVDISKYNGVTSPDYRVFTLEERAAYKNYYLYLLQLGYNNKIFYPLGQGAAHVGRWRLPADAFKEFRAPCPPKNEQQNIVEFLDRETARIDNLVTEKQIFINLLTEKRHALIHHVVTKGLDANVKMKDSGSEWIGGVPVHWDCSKVRYLSNYVGTGGTPKSQESFCDEGGICWFSPGDFNGELTINASKKKITVESINNGDAKLFPENSVPVIGIGGTLGKVALSKASYSCNQQINVIVPNSKVIPEYLVLALSVQRGQMKILSNASTIGIMNQEKTKQIIIALPSKNEQAKIVSYANVELEKIFSIMSEVSNSIELLKEHRSALINAAVTGKIDVRKHV